MGEKNARSLDDLERAIARSRIDLMADVDALQRVVRKRLDWRRPIRRHPWATLGAAFALAFFIAWR